MRKLIDLEAFLPGSDWQRLETWAALAGMTPMDYLRACVRRGHAALSAELAQQADSFIRPAIDGDGHQRG